MKKFIAIISMLVILSTSINANAVLVIIQEKQDKPPKVVEEVIRPRVVMSDIKLCVNGNKVMNNVLIFDAGRSYLSLRKVAEELGLKVGWYDDGNGDRRITIDFQKANEVKEIKKTKDIPYQDDIVASPTDIKLFVKGVKLTDTVMIIDGRSHLPLRSIADALGLVIGWDEDTKVINIAFE